MQSIFVLLESILRNAAALPVFFHIIMMMAFVFLFKVVYSFRR